MRSFRLIIGTAVVLAISVFVILNQQASDYPLLIAHNGTQQPLELVALLPAGERAIGSLAPSARRQFRVRDDAERRFRAVFPDGEAVETGPVYFTAGLQVTLTIRSTGIEVARESPP